MKKILTITLLAIVVLSCKKSFLEETPVSILSPENLYVSKSGFEQGLYGLYNQMRQERGGYLQNGSTADPNNNISNGIMMVGVDNAYSNYPAANNEKYYNFFSTGSSISMVADSYNSTIFSWLYQVINGANTIIGRADNTPGINWTLAQKGQIVGEAKIVRAWAYRHLTFLWGAVPLVLQESTGANIQTNYVRTPVAQIRAQMEQDLLYADSTMADEAIDEGRLSKAVADHYLTELYLSEGRYQDAENMANKIINNPMYKLVTKRYGVNISNPGTAFTDMFIDGNSNRSQGNSEAIWVLQNQYLSLGADYNIMRRYWVDRYDVISINGKTPIVVSIANGGRGLGRFAATKFQFQLFNNTVDGRTGSSSTDVRGGSTGGTYSWRFSWTYGSPATKFNLNYSGNETLNNDAWPNTRKWDWAPSAQYPNDVTQPSGYNCQIYIRLAEEYLFLAEAKFYLGDLTGAAQAINVLRARANAPLCAASDISIDFILDERSRELFSEEHRRYTLLRIRDPQNPSLPIWIRRTNKYNLIIANNPVIPTDTLLPIPQVVINSNLTLPMPQNPGY